MIIDRIEIAWIRMPLPEGRGLSGGPITHSSDAVCRITTAGGLQGIGEARGGPLDEVCAVIDTALRPVLMGRHAAETTDLWHAMHDALLGRDAPEHAWAPRTALAAIAAVDLALWDIKARAAGLSVCRLLGGRPQPMPAYLSEGFYIEGQSLEEMAADCVAGLEAGGYRALKIRIGRDPDDDVARVRAVRQAVGNEVALMVDVNQAWDLERAAATLPRLEGFGLFWLEEPCPLTRPAGDFTAPERLAARIAELTAIPLASGENHTTLAECRSLVQNAPLRYMQFDAVKNGGVTEFLRVAALCLAHGIPMAPHHVPHFHVQLAVAAPNGMLVETFPNERQHVAWPDLFPGFPGVQDGMMACPDGPGWGMTVNDDLIDRHGVKVNWG